jgi:hypothetical protein
MITQKEKTEHSKLTRALNLDYEDTTEPIMHTQRALRRLIGILGISLPLIIWLIVYSDAGHTAPLDSISHYYFTRANTAFIAVVSLMAFFLFVYKGHEPIDFYISFIAGLGAILLVLFPTSNITKACSDDEMIWSTTFLRLTDYSGVRVEFHYACAAIFLLCLAYMSIFLFTRPSGPLHVEKKKLRNCIYIGCGVLMVISLVFIGMRFFEVGIGLKFYDQNHLTFWFETIAIVSFGFSWLIKGETLFRGRRDAIVEKDNDKEEASSDKLL